MFLSKKLIAIRGIALVWNTIPSIVQTNGLVKKPSMGKKIWRSRAWRELRAAKIGDRCEQCGTTSGPMVLQHLWHPPDRDRLETEVAYSQHLTPGSATAIYESLEVARALHDRYMSGDDTQTWCRKCAYMWDVHHKKLCPICRINYCDINYEECYECHLKGETSDHQLDLFSQP